MAYEREPGLANYVSWAYGLYRYDTVTGYWKVFNAGSLEFCQELATRCWGEGLFAISMKRPALPVSPIEYGRKRGIVDAVKNYSR